MVIARQNQGDVEKKWNKKEARSGGEWRHWKDNSQPTGWVPWQRAGNNGQRPFHTCRILKSIFEMQAAFNFQRTGCRRRRHHRRTAALSLLHAISNFGQVGSPQRGHGAMGLGAESEGEDENEGGAKELNGGQCVVRLFPYAKDVAPANKVSPLACRTDGPSESENFVLNHQHHRKWVANPPTGHPLTECLPGL